jgi:hypothetical protein
MLFILTEHEQETRPLEFTTKNVPEACSCNRNVEISWPGATNASQERAVTVMEARNKRGIIFVDLLSKMFGSNGTCVGASRPLMISDGGSQRTYYTSPPSLLSRVESRESRERDPTNKQQAWGVPLCMFVCLSSTSSLGYYRFSSSSGTKGSCAQQQLSTPRLIHGEALNERCKTEWLSTLPAEHWEPHPDKPPRRNAYVHTTQTPEPPAIL